MTHLSNWREESDLFEVVTGKMTDEKALKKVDEKKGIKNKVVINPKLTEAIKELGGELIEATEEDENGDTVDPRKEAEKKSEEQKKKQIENKQKRAQMIKKQVLMKKLIAVRQGSEDIVAGYKPEGEVIEGYAKPKIPEKLVAKVRVKKSAKVQGKDVKESSAVLDANTKLQKKDERKKKEAELRRLLNHAIAMKKGRAESVEPEGQVVSEKVKGQDTELRKMAALDRAAGIDKRLSPKAGRRSVKPVNYRKEEVVTERLGGKGYKSYTSLTGKKVSGDWEDSDRGAGNKAKKRAGGKVEKKSPTYLAHVHNKEEVVHEGDYHSGQGEKIQKRTKKWMDKKGQKGAPGLDAMKARTAEHKAKRGVKEEVVDEGLGAAYAVGGVSNAIASVAKAYGASQAAKGAIIGGALSGGGAVVGGALNYAASRNKDKNKKSESKKKKMKEDKAFNFVVDKLRKQYGKDAVLTKGQKPKPPTAKQKAEYAAHKAKLAKQDHRDPTEKASDGRYSDRYSNRGSD